MTAQTTAPRKEGKTNRIRLERTAPGRLKIREKMRQRDPHPHGEEHGHGHEHAVLYWGERTTFVCDPPAERGHETIEFQIGELHLATEEELEILREEDPELAGIEFATCGPASPFAAAGGTGFIDRSFDWSPLVEAGREIESPRVDSSVIEEGKAYCFKFTWKVKTGRHYESWDPHIIVHGGPKP